MPLQRLDEAFSVRRSQLLRWQELSKSPAPLIIRTCSLMLELCQELVCSYHSPAHVTDRRPKTDACPKPSLRCLASPRQGVQDPERKVLRTRLAFVTKGRASASVRLCMRARFGYPLYLIYIYIHIDYRYKYRLFGPGSMPRLEYSF